MKVGVIVQARTGSLRYPGKIYQDICGKYTLQRVLENVSKSTVAQKVVLAMPSYDESEFNKRFGNLEFSECVDNRFSTYFGSPEDLLERYFFAARENSIDLIVRVTGDCPLIQGQIIDEMIIHYLKNGYNTFMGSGSLISTIPYPDGIDVEIFPFWMLAEANILAKSPEEREHVCPFMYNGKGGYKIIQFLNKEPSTIISTKHKDVSFDTKEDYKLICKIAKIYDKCGNINTALESV